ncbi:MAG: hypothetical protein JOZ16_05240 [Methylobacteriaceae bacterium]|nr:hypothetical protein [Methylobacteriaceae bacterium]
MRSIPKILGVALSAGLALGITASASANGARHQHRHAVAHMHTRTLPAYPYGYRLMPGYVYYVPTHVFRCYPARQMVVDQVGLVAGYVPLGTCG